MPTAAQASTSQWPLLVTFVVYLLGILLLGIRAYRQTHDLGDYLLGGRKLGAAVTALSVGASDMSGWLLLGLPGAVYLSGLQESWIGIGLVVGAYLNWILVARRLRVFSFHANNSLTLPDYLENRFKDDSRLLRILSAAVILLFFTFYAASGLVSGAILFESSFGLDYGVALIIGAVVIVSYTFVGGFLAVAWTDAIQACLMAAALVMTPIAVFSAVGGTREVLDQVALINPTGLDLFGDVGALGLLSLIAWGLGYAGQPHILTRFMAIEDPAQLTSARRLAMSWMVIMLAGSVATGFAGMAYFAAAPLTNPETVFISLSQALFNPWMAGVITAAILSAIMSTIDSQLLVCSSVISEDFYRTFLRPHASSSELVMVSRLAVVGVALISLVIAMDRESRVLDLVSYAWAGFGAAFGPVILLSLFMRSMTAQGAIAGMLAGAITVVVWSNLVGGIFDLYEIVPGFAVSLICVLAVSLRWPERREAVLGQFDEARALSQNFEQAARVAGSTESLDR
ncbi:sodium/proline symporter PutP [Gammaproteobacteria bacterium]|nr:sodium/proline symporter PutP [Gammaproteobacteria bacterium]